jgi:hypothetical protein
MLNSDSLDATLHSACDTDVLGWKTDAGILFGSNPPPPASEAEASSSGIVWINGATVGPGSAVPLSDEKDSLTAGGISSDQVVVHSSGFTGALCTGEAACSSSGIAVTNLLPRRLAASWWNKLPADDEDEDEDDDEVDCLPCSGAAASSFGSSGAGTSTNKGLVALALSDDGASVDDSDVGIAPVDVVTLALGGVQGEDGDAGEPGWASIPTPKDVDVDCLPFSRAAASSFGSSGTGISTKGVVALTLPEDAVSGADGDVGITPKDVVSLALPDDDGVHGEDGDPGEPGWGSMPTPEDVDVN